MSLKQQVQRDFIEAFKAKEELKSSTLKMLQSEIKNAEIVKKGKGGDGELVDEEVLQIIGKEARKRKESADIFEREGRTEMAEKEKKEFAILSAYLPEQMGEEEIKKLVKEAIEKTGAAGPKDIGKVMGAVNAQIRGRAEGGVVSGIVKELLA